MKQDDSMGPTRAAVQRDALLRAGSIHWFHWFVVIASLALTVIAWRISKQKVLEKVETQFGREADQVIELVVERLQKYEDGLWGGVGVVAANRGAMDGQTWLRFTKSLRIEEKYPGVSGIGVIHRIDASELGAYLERERTWRPDFRVHPKHNEGEYWPITYIEPVANNWEAVGLDMAHETNRLAAARKARDTGTAQLTGPIVLVQDSKKTPGFLLFVPFYDGANHENESDRHEHFAGMIYAPFIMSELMAGTLSQKSRHLGVSISDGAVTLYSEHNAKVSDYDSVPLLSRTRSVELYGRTWSFDIRSDRSFRAAAASSQPLTILLSGIAIDFFLLVLIVGLSRANRRAVQYSDGVNAELNVKAEMLKVKADDLSFLAHHDPLTGLANRVTFRTLAEQALARARRRPADIHPAVLVLDLDRFKDVNDTLGHEVGDQLLVNVAKRLQLAVRNSDTVARLGGDEFAVLIDNVKVYEQTAAPAQRIVDALADAMQLPEQKLNVTTSIGIAVFPENGESVEGLLRNADSAMYSAKEKGGNNYQFFDRDMHQRALHQMELERDLRDAFERGEFLLHYQPLSRCDGGQPVCFEALLRWQHPRLGLMQPDQFLALLERTGQIVQVGEWVLERACAQMRQWQKVHGAKLRIAVNVSPRQFDDPGLIDKVAGALKSSELPPECLELEVTESLVMRDIETATRTLESLKSLGVRVAIDDFGTGYSQLVYLVRFPVDTLKIDRSIIQTIGGRDGDTVTRTVIEMGRSLGLEVVAEGVEEAAQLQFLREQNCDTFQGYLVTRPLSVVACEEWLAGVQDHGPTASGVPTNGGTRPDASRPTRVPTEVD